MNDHGDDHNHAHDQSASSGPAQETGNIRFDHEGKTYEFPGEAAPYVGHDGDSAVRLPDSGELLAIHLDKEKPPNVMHVHLADFSEEEISEAGGRIWQAKLANQDTP